MVYYSTNANFTSLLAMLMIVLQNNDRLSLTLPVVFNIASVKIAVIAIVSAHWADTVLFF